MIGNMAYDYESIKIILPSGPTLMVESINYSDEQGGEVITGQNGMPVGRGRSGYSGKCDIEMARDEFEKLDAALTAQGGGAFYNHSECPITVSYGSLGQKTIIEQLFVHFSSRDFSQAKGDTNLKVKLSGVLTKPIIRNGSPAYAPSL